MKLAPLAASLLCASVVLTACSSAPTRIHPLMPAPAATRLDYRGPPARLDVVHVPPAYDRLEIVTAAPERLNLHELDCWPATFSETARQVVSANLTRRLPGGMVVFPHLPKDEAAGISVDILEVASTADGTTMHAGWQISYPAGERRRGEAELHDPHAMDDVRNAVQAWSGLLGQLADRLSTQLAAR